MGTIASQITTLTIVYSTVYSDADQRKYQCSALLAFVWGIHRRPVNSPHKWPVTRKMFPFDDVIMAWPVLNSKMVNEKMGKFQNTLIWRRHSDFVTYACVSEVCRHWFTLQRHNGRNGDSNHRPLDCLLNRLFRRRSEKTSRLSVTGLCEGNSPMTGEFPAQRASKAENVSTWWRHQDIIVGRLSAGKACFSLWGFSNMSIVVLSAPITQQGVDKGNKEVGVTIIWIELYH